MEEKTGDLDVMSPESPLGAALIGASAGDWVEYQAPNGVLKVKVVAVETA
jgi:transcription elongation factor GreA